MSESVENTVDLSEAGLEAAATTAIQAFENASDLDELANARRDHLGDEAPIPAARRSLGTLPKDQRKEAGRLVNMARGRVEKRFNEVKEELEVKRNQEVLRAEKIDPGRRPPCPKSAAATSFTSS